MTRAMRMPLSTRLWIAALVVAGCFFAWAIAWPSLATPHQGRPGEDVQLPVYPAIAAESNPRPNPADAAWARPLFFNDRAPRVAALDAGAPGSSNSGFDVTLTGIVRSSGLNLATLSVGGKPLRVRLGDEVEGQSGWRLVDLAPRAATFRNGERVQEIRLDARDVAAGPMPPAPPPAPQTSPDLPRPSGQAPPPPVPGITGQAPTAPPVTSSGSPAPVTAPANTGQEQQIQAIRRRIEDARRQIRQSNSPEPSR